jgi:hypothetical protein
MAAERRDPSGTTVACDLDTTTNGDEPQGWVSSAEIHLRSLVDGMTMRAMNNPGYSVYCRKLLASASFAGPSTSMHEFRNVK